MKTVSRKKVLQADSSANMRIDVAILALVCRLRPSSVVLQLICTQLGFLTWNAIFIYLASIGITRDLWNIRAMDMSHLLYVRHILHQDIDGY